MTEKNTNKHLENKIIETLKTVFDPEISVNIYDLGLIYKINIDDDKNTFEPPWNKDMMSETALLELGLL
jgi:metal-sulfur cluster biosynthetic enzyme